jgi:hypothetical protein
MYNNDENKSNYEGLFASTPNRVQEGIWGRVETHERTFEPDVLVRKDWFGGVQSVEQDNWFNS